MLQGSRHHLRNKQKQWQQSHKVLKDKQRQGRKQEERTSSAASFFGDKVSNARVMSGSLGVRTV